MESRKKSSKITISEEESGKRIDKFLAEYFKDQYSRSFFKKLIEESKVKVNEKKVTPHYKIAKEDLIEITFPSPKLNVPEKEEIPLEIVFENEDIAIINKFAGMVVHPTDDGQHMTGTLVNALLNHFGKKRLSDLNGPLRLGIVHRLDKDTSGLIIIAKNNDIHKYIVDLMKQREIEKKYIVLVYGHLKSETGRIEAPLMRAIRDRKKMSLAEEGMGKHAITEYKVKDYIEVDQIDLTLAEIKILTGRTHQIRVHFKSIGYPVIGDLIYGNKKINTYFQKFNLKRQFLHAAKIKFIMPDGEKLEIKSDLPKDLKEVLNAIKKY